MSEETQEIETTTEETVQVQAPAFDPFSDQPEQPSNIVNETTQTSETTSQAAEEATKTDDVSRETEDEEEIVDANEYLKQNLGFDDWDAAKAALAELKTLKESGATKAEIKFANDESKKIIEALQGGDTDPLYEYLEKKKTLSALDKMDAESAIKLQIKQSKPHFKSDDIQDVFEERYAIPEKPEQKVDELDEEFESRLDKWKAKVEKVNRRIERDAVEAKAELSKSRTELVLPDIFKQEETKKAPEPTPEELARNKAYTESFLKSVETSLKSFEGLTATVVDKDVKIPIAYQATEEQKTKISNDLKTLAANNYDVNVLLAPRWVKEDGTLNTEQIAKDYFRLLYGEQAEQKFANEAATKRVVEKAKKDSNIVIKSNSTPQRTFTATTNADEQKKMAEFFFQNG